MKLKLCFLAILLFLVSITFISAQEIQISTLRDTYDTRETVQAEILLDGEPIETFSTANIFLERDSEQIRIAPILLKISEKKYFVYFDLPNPSTGQYQLKVKLPFILNNVLTEITKITEFQVEIKETSITFKPAVILLDIKQNNPSFKVFITNQKPNSLELQLSTEEEYIYPSRNSLTIPPLDTKYFYIYTKTNQVPINLTKTLIHFGEYSIPILIKNKEVPTAPIIEPPINTTEPIENITQEPRTIEFLTKTNFLEQEITQSQVIKGPLKFKNFLDRPLTNLKFSLTRNLKDIMEINLTSLDQIAPNETKTQYLLINQDKSAIGTFTGELILTAEEYTISLPISIKIESNIRHKPNISEVSENKTEQPTEEPEILPLDLTEEDSSKESDKAVLIKTLTVIIIVLILLFLFYQRMSKKKQTSKKYIQ